jgi:hypothetical protein
MILPRTQQRFIFGAMVSFGKRRHPAWIVKIESRFNFRSLSFPKFWKGRGARLRLQIRRELARHAFDLFA